MAEEGPPEEHPPHGEPGERRGFRRRRPPSPQATRLMLMSVVASVGLAVVLGVVFLPVLLEQEARTRNPVYILEAETTDSRSRIAVTTAANPRSHDAFDLALRVLDEEGNETARFLGPLSPDQAVGPVRFVDAQDDGILNAEDHFLVEVEPGRTYVLLILLKGTMPQEEGGVGGVRWTVPSPAAAP